MALWLVESSEENLTLGLGLLAEHEGLATANNLNTTNLGNSASKLDGDLLGGFGLFAEDRFGLASKTSLLGGVATITLGVAIDSTLLILGDLVDGMLLTLG